MLNKRNFFTTFDLASGYYQYEIDSEHRIFLGFEWTFKDVALDQHVMSLQKFTGPSQNTGGGRVLKPLFVSTMVFKHFEVLELLVVLVNLLEMIFFLLGLWLTPKRVNSILKQNENG